MNNLIQLNSALERKKQHLIKPLFLQLRIDEICNIQCSSGNVWQLQSSPTELDHLSDILLSSLLTEVQIVEICSRSPLQYAHLKGWISKLCEQLPDLTRIDLVLPVLEVNHIIDCLTQIASVIEAQDVQLTIRFDLTASELFKEDHPASSNLQPLIHILDFVQGCEFIADYNLELTIKKTTIYSLHDWLEFAIDRQVPIVYKLAVPEQISETDSAIAASPLDFEEKYHLVIFLENLLLYYKTSTPQSQFYRSLIGQLIEQTPRTVGCKWQAGGITLSTTGDLSYCAIASKPLGSGLEQDPVTLYESHQEHWQQILQTACRTCMQDCILPGATEPLPEAAKSPFRMGIKPFNLPSQIKSLKLLKPLKTLRLQAGFQKHLQSLGVNSDTRSVPNVALHFPDTRSSKRKVLICGWYGTETLGDKAILGGVVQALQDAIGDFELHLVAIEVYISQMTIQQMPELQECVLHSLTDGLGVVSSMDLVVFGGGPLMAIGAMAEMMAFFQRAVAAKIPTLLAGCGVGPLGATFLNHAVRHVLLHSSYRIYRDQKSLENARSLGVDVSQDIVAEDPAFTWLASKTDRWTTSPDASAPSRLILGLRDWPYHEFAAEMGGLEAERLKHRFEQEVVAGLEQLIEQHPNLEIIAFPMCTNHLGFDDRWFYRRLFRDRPQLQAVVNFSYLGAELSPDASLAVFQSATAALAMRFHSLVFALSCGVPAVAIDYTLGRGKVRSLAEKYQVPYQGLDTISADFIASSLSRILTGKSNPSTMAFQQRTLTFKDSVKAVVMSLNR